MAVQISRRAEAVEYTLEIPGNKTERVAHGGSFVRVRSANRSFSLRLGDSAPFSLTPGSQYTAPAGEFFPSILVVNDTADTLVVVLIIGQGDISQDASPLPPPPTTLVSSATNTIGAGAGVTFTGIPSAGLNQRVALLVSNKDPAVGIEIRDAAGVAGVFVKAGDTVQIQSSGELEVFNPTGAPVAVAMSELWVINP